jgi:AcrR family transcriptional regulator
MSKSPSKQAERSETTRREILRVARDLLGEHGYEGTSLDDVAESAGVTKGAVYHHFDGKRSLFQAVFEMLEEELCAGVIEASASAGSDVLEGMRLGVRAFLESAGDTPCRRIVLIEGPSVLGWETWREIDERYGFGLVKSALEAAMAAGVLEKRPVDPIAHIFLAALSEAALQVARADDPDTARAEMFDALWSMIESLRT